MANTTAIAVLLITFFALVFLRVPIAYSVDRKSVV